MPSTSDPRVGPAASAERCRLRRRLRVGRRRPIRTHILVRPCAGTAESRGSRPNCGPCAGHRTDPAAIPWAVRICGGGEAVPELAAPVGEVPGAATAVRRHQLHRVRRPQRRPARHPPQRPRFQLEFESLHRTPGMARHGRAWPTRYAAISRLKKKNVVQSRLNRSSNSFSAATTSQSTRHRLKPR